MKRTENAGIARVPAFSRCSVLSADRPIVNARNIQSIILTRSMENGILRTRHGIDLKQKEKLASAAVVLGSKTCICLVLRAPCFMEELPVGTARWPLNSAIFNLEQHTDI